MGRHGIGQFVNSSSKHHAKYQGPVINPDVAIAIAILHAEFHYKSHPANPFTLVLQTSNVSMFLEIGIGTISNYFFY